MIAMNSLWSKYFNEDIDNPNFLYLASTEEVDFAKLKREYQSGENLKIVMTSDYYLACTSAFANKIKEINEGREYYLDINRDNVPMMVAHNIIDLDDNQIAHLYIFPYTDDFNSEGNSQYSTEEFVTPVKVKEVPYKDFKVYYKITSNTRTRK